MAKARTTDLTLQLDSTKDQTGRMAPAPLPQSASSNGIRVVQIEIPLTGQDPPTEFTFHVDCKLTPQQSTIARRIARQLDYQNSCLKNGQRIVNVHGALKWLLEQIADQLN